MNRPFLPSSRARPGLWSRRLPLRAAILGFSALLLVLDWRDNAEQAAADQALTVKAAYAQDANLVQALAEHVAHTVRDADTLANLAAGYYATEGARTELGNLVQSRTLDPAALHSLFIADEHGAVVKQAGLAPRDNVREASYFQAHSGPSLAPGAGARAGRAPFVGRPERAGAQGPWVMRISRPLQRAGGGFGGIACVTVNLGYFVDFFRQADVGPLGVLDLVGIDGISRVRVSAGRGSHGLDMSQTSLMRHLAERANGQFESDGVVEPVRRYVSYRTLPGYPLVLLLGRAQDEVLALPRQRHRQENVHSAVFTVLVCAFAVLVVAALSRRERSAHALAHSEAQLRAMFGHAPIGIARTGMDGRILQANPRFCALLGYAVEELESLTWQQITHPQDIQDSEAAELRLARSESPDSHERPALEKRYLHKSGGTVWVNVSASLIRDPHGQPAYFVKMVEGISERKRIEQELQHLAHHDTLTGLPNRAMLQQRLAQVVAQASRRGWTTGVLFVDLDRFKEVNDTLGHAAGDALLRHVATQLSRCVRKDDTVGRLGGDEFAIILSDLGQAENAALTAQKILDALEQPLAIAGHDVHVSASIGIATSPPEASEPEGLLRKADTAMYEAKQAGRAAYRFYTAGSNERLQRRNALLRDMRYALAHDEFVLHYQPKGGFADGRITGLEALLRWRKADGTLVPPGEFVPLLEESGLIVPVGGWVVRAACAQIQAWQQGGLAVVPIAINLSPRQFHEQDLCDMVARALEDFQVSPRHLDVEITESAAMHNPEQAADTLRRLKAMGLRIAIDDFGTGYSSLAYLQRFPIDTIKIDRAFVTALPGNAGDASIAKAVIGLAHALKLKVVAEGVETAEQRDFLAHHDCDQMQGYYLSRPLDAERCTALLRQAGAAAS